ncbi:sporulation protein YunB [Bacillus sp. 03113]|uniref:sporulation protein YunB n=1 Tax=Bacillus sp. 03113 TaxID=2578211 RepID=UPI001143A2A7|nr:sporulation protein YunB [Bacillus sp. 03113]
MWKKYRWIRRRHHKRPLGFPKVMLITLIVFIIFNMFSLWVIDHSIKPIIQDISKIEINRIATDAINDSINENITNKVDLEKLIVFHKREDGFPPTYSFNPNEYNRIMSITTKDIEKRLGIVHSDEIVNRNLNNIEDAQLGSVIYYIPLGVATKNTLLANLGPKIPVKLALVRDVESKFLTKFSDVGINNSWLELFVEFKINIQVVIPFHSENTAPISQQVKVGDLFIPGQVPDYYSKENGLPNPASIHPTKKQDKK